VLRKLGLQEVVPDVVEAPQQVVLFACHLVQVREQRLAIDGVDHRDVEHIARLNPGRAGGLPRGACVGRVVIRPA
jgi:hypothetical protein